MSGIPKLVIFDMDDVLCHYDLGRRLRELSMITGKLPRDIRAAIWDSGFEDEADAGGFPDPEEYLWQFSVRIGYPVTRSEWIAARRKSMVPSQDVLELAKAIGRTTRLAIYTNNGPLVKDGLEDLFPEAAEIFSERFCSFEFGTKKPDPASFKRLMEKMGVSPDEAWFIDDKKSNVKGALLAGLNAHHYRTYAALLHDARDLGFTISH
jgi:HAD superfamily hydrolase (TIGR01509 family)